MRPSLRVSTLVFLLASIAASAPADGGDTLMTDPDLLARFGFPRDARSVYLARGAVLDQKSTPAQPKEYGTEDSGWMTLLGDQHIPFSSSNQYASNLDSSIYYTGGGNAFHAPLHLPSGALLKQVAFFVQDNGTGSIDGVVLKVCQTGFPIGPPVTTVLGSASTGDGDTVFTVTVPPGEAINNFSCAYAARTVFGNPPGPDLALRKIRAAWQRQVSAAPAVATFPNDVPTTHPYFRFIEALAASGITAGCAPGSFCPNSPITRGEMAVFLAAALGLHWP